ncbi:MAG: glycosyltransferase [Verrucomicrobia bacterium]|nr:glycosyltransferase [Verrucomicrobiota bacterium]
MTPRSLLLLIPAYNEEHRIEPVLRDYAAFFSPRYGGRFQLVVVLNGCRDNTLGVVQRLAQEYPCIRWLDFQAPIGKGGALIEGFKLAAQAEAIGFVDADGATAPAAFQALVERLGEADAVIGSRWLPGAVIHNLQTGRRRFASRVFHLIVQCLFWMSIRDTQCGAKVVKSAAVEQIHPKLRIADMAFDINLLYSLKHAGYRVLEVPTEWTDKAGSKVHFFRTSLTMFLSALRIRLVYSPCYRWMAPLRPLENWLYLKLRAPAPIPGPDRTTRGRQGS